MFHMQERQLLLSLIFKKPVHNAVRCFSCFSFHLHRNLTLKMVHYKMVSNIRWLIKWKNVGLKQNCIDYIEK